MAETEPTRAELVEACKAVGLPFYGTKADLAARLAARSGDIPPDPAPEPAEVDPFASEPTPEPESDGEPPFDWRLPADVQATPASGVYSAEYDVDELDDDSHAELCARVVADALAAGYRTRGGGRRIAGTGQRHTYGVSVR